MQRSVRAVLLSQAGLAALMLVSVGQAQAVDVTITGFVRQEIALKTTGRENPLNQHGNVFNAVEVSRDASAFAPLLGVPPEALKVPVIRTGPSRDNAVNLFATRAEINIQARFSDNLKMFGKIRGYFDPGIYKDFGGPNFFESPFFGNSGSLLEFSGRHHEVDLPALYFDYAKGPIWVRLGNQQIAWGESIFFRVLDVPNGLDLRRHSILDPASEEFSDKRVASPAVRLSYKLTDDWEVEGFAQQFSPSILPNANTPYNTIAAQFTVHQRKQFNAVDDTVNFGGRVRGQVGELGLQLIAVRRRNPDGIFRWTRSGVNRDLPGVPGSGAVLANTPFEVDPTGVRSAKEWFYYAAFSRLDPVQGLNAAIDDFQPWTGLLGAVNTEALAALFGGTAEFWTRQELDLFFQLSGGLRGHIERLYPKETILGAGFNYMFFADPGSFLDQLIVRFEATFTPNRKFTNPTLGQRFMKEDELISSLALEKFHRFSRGFPATFISLQWMYRSASDLFGRHLSGMGRLVNGSPKGLKNFNAISLAIQQPFPNLIWRADLAVLYDVKGGVLVQPALRWKPKSQWTIELYANILDGHGNDNIIRSIDYADEVVLRVGYQF